MKLIVLTDGSINNFSQMVNIIEDKETFLVSTEHCDEDHEYLYIKKSIKDFVKSNKEIMLVKFSGKEDIANELGDTCSEMLIPLSYNKQSKFYMECPIETFSKLVNIF